MDSQPSVFLNPTVFLDAFFIWPNVRTKCNCCQRPAYCGQRQQKSTYGRKIDSAFHVMALADTCLGATRQAST